MEVRNLKGNSGREVPNQFVIEHDGVIWFQSYESLVAKTFYADGCRKIILGRDWDYSVTTMKYLHRWLSDYCGLDMTAKEIRKAIQKGEIEYDENMK